MLFSLALIFLIGLAASALCARLRLPGIIGMLLTGIPARSLSTESARPVSARSQRRPAGNGALPQRSAVRSAVTFLREKDLNLRLFTGQAALNQFRLASAAAGQKAIHLLAQSARVDAAVGGKGVFVIALPAGKDRGQRRAPLTEQQRIPAQILGGEPGSKVTT